MSVVYDISTELGIIATEVYGSVVKQAICDALIKVNDTSGDTKNTGPDGIARSLEGPNYSIPERVYLVANDAFPDECNPGTISDKTVLT